MEGLFFILCYYYFFFYLGGTNYASSSTASHCTLSNPCSCECICPYSVSHQREHKHALFGPRRSQQQLGEHANNRHTGLFLSLSVSLSRYATAGPIMFAHSVPLDHTGSITHLCYYDPRTVMRNVSGRQSISKFSLSCFALQGSPSILL